MKRVFLLPLVLSFIIILVACCPCSGYSAQITNNLSESLNEALRLKEAGDIQAATTVLQKASSLIDSAQSGQSDANIYNRQYLQTLIECLQGNEIAYLTVIKHVSSLVKDTKELFTKVSAELESGAISPQSQGKISQMQQEVSRLMVTHAFCLPPEKYEKLYRLIESSLYRYSKAWGGLYLSISKEAEEKAALKAEALLNFQRANELFNQAAALMVALPKK